MLNPVFGLLGGLFTSGSALTQAALSRALVRRALCISSWWHGSGQTLKVSWSPFFQTLGSHQGHGHQMDQPDSPHPRPNTFPAERVQSRSPGGVGSLSFEGGAGLSFVPVRRSWGVLGQVPGHETQPFPEVFNRKSDGGGFTGHSMSAEALPCAGPGGHLYNAGPCPRLSVPSMGTQGC